MPSKAKKVLRCYILKVARQFVRRRVCGDNFLSSFCLAFISSSFFSSTQPSFIYMIVPVNETTTQHILKVIGSK